MTSRPITFWPLILIPLALLFLSHCRADMSSDDTRLESTGDGWFNSYGEEGTCEAPSATCREVDNDKIFIDACVDAGHKAKTCGCSVKCSADIGYKRTRLANGSLMKSSQDESSCSAEDNSYLQRLKTTLPKTRELASCINGHICQGHTVYCTGSNAEVSQHIRRLAKTTCQAEVSLLFCPSGRVNSWECPNDAVETLSREWTAAFETDDKPLRSCFQGVVCNNSEARCAPNLLDRARSIKHLLSDSSCSYWYKSFCSLDGNL